ncbi:MAG: TonB family protein [Acidobacteriaceae bacterium]|jgi:TonB family protein
MIRKIVTSAFVLSPILLLAQASPPAQTSPPAEMSSLIQPSNSATPRNDESSITSTSAPVRISDGIVAPKLIHSANIKWAGDADSADKIVVVHFTVDPTGKPVNLSIVSSTSPTMNRNVLDGVKQYRFQPGTLDNSPYSVPMTLEVVLRSPND